MCVGCDTCMQVTLPYVRSYLFFFLVYTMTKWLHREKKRLTVNSEILKCVSFLFFLSRYEAAIGLLAEIIVCVCDVIHYYPCDKGQVKEN